MGTDGRDGDGTRVIAARMIHQKMPKPASRRGANQTAQKRMSSRSSSIGLLVEAPVLDGRLADGHEVVANGERVDHVDERGLHLAEPLRGHGRTGHRTASMLLTETSRSDAKSASAKTQS